MRLDDPLTDAETFKLDGRRLIEIGNRPNSLGEVEGQYMGLLRFTPSGWERVKKLPSSVSAMERDKMDMTNLLQRLIADGAEIWATSISYLIRRIN